MFWRKIACRIGTGWTDFMDELERNKDALKQGAVAVVCLTAAAAGMNTISHRGAEQRADAEWGARALAFNKTMGEHASTPRAAAQVELASFKTGSGYSARAQAMPIEDGAFERSALTVSTSVRDSRALAALRPFQPAALSEAARVTRESECLAQAIYYEARGESYDGQMAVAEVIVNRTRSSVYPSTVCGVVYQGAERVTGCQFTFTCDGSLDQRPRGEAWMRSKALATEVMMGFARPVTHRATHYHTTEVAPVWSSSLVETTRIGAHIFYRFPTRAEKRRDDVPGAGAA
jgi:spore germination cell wall hydrolase CwlJ-like protein